MEALPPAEAPSYALSLVTAAGLTERVQVALRDERTLTLSGPDGFGFLGSTAWQVVRVALPCTRAAIAFAVARHVFGEFYAEDNELRERVAELPLALALAIKSQA